MLFRSNASLNGPQSENYSLLLENAPATQANIIAKTLTIGGSFTVANKTFDNSNQATMEQNNLVLEGVVEDDEVSLHNIAIVFSQVDAGNDIAVYINSAELSGSDAFNYNLSLDNAPTSTGNIIPPQVFNLTINIVGSGSVNVDGTPYSETVQVIEGNTIFLNATPNANWAFGSWSGDLNSIQPFESMLVSSDINITATFVDMSTPQFTLTLNITGNGTVNVNGQAYTSPLTVFEGTILNLEAIAETDWHFATWSGDLVSVLANESVVMNSNKTIGVIFEEGNGIVENYANVGTVYPNPFSNKIMLNTSSGVKSASISTVSGQIVLQIMNPGESIETSHLNAGIYFIQIENLNGKTHVQKLIKE